MTTRSSAALSAVLPGLRVPSESRMRAALGTGGLGAALLAVAPALPMAAAADGATTAPAFTAGPLLAVLAIGPVALAWVLAGGGRAGYAAGVLAGLAALAPGRAMLDLQLLAAPWRAARPELLVPTSLAPLRAGAGSWALLLGHLLTVVAGVLAVLAVRRAANPGLPAGPPPAAAGATGLSARSAGGVTGPAGASPGTAAVAGAAPRTGSPVLTAALCAGAVAAVGLVLAPFRSADPYLLPRSAIDAPPLTMFGLLLLAGAVVLAGSIAASAADVQAGRGALLGVGLGVAAVAVPMAAAALAPDLGASWGPWIALAGGAGLLGASRLVGREARTAGDELSLPALDRLHAVAGALAVAAGLLALVGAVARQVLVPVGSPEPVLYPVRLLVPAGLLLAALGGVLLAGAFSTRYARSAALVRPALAVAWAGMALAGTAVLDAALTATQIGGVRAGLGVWAAALALLAAPAAGCAAVIAGGVERDEVDLSDVRASPVASAVGGLAAVLAVPAFGLPLLTAEGYAQAGLWSNFQVASWGLVVALVAVVVASMLAPWSRPSRAAGLLLGAAAVVGLHLAELPLTGGRAGAGATAAAGTWFSLACAVVLLAAAAVAWRQRRPARPGTGQAGSAQPRSGRAG